jgi:hypothetical protein
MPYSPPPGVLRFSDNTGTARFSVTNAANIVALCTMLLGGRDYGQPLSMKSVLVAGASESDPALVVRAFGAPQATSFRKDIMWQWKPSPSETTNGGTVLARVGHPRPQAVSQTHLVGNRPQRATRADNWNCPPCRN